MTLTTLSSAGLRRSVQMVLAMALCLSLASPAASVDGVIEINDAKALAGDVTGTGGDLRR